jgi:hypothetical protein
MKLPLAPLAAALLGVSVSACGANRGTHPIYPVSPRTGPTHYATTSPANATSVDDYLKNDGDKDFDDVQHDRGNPENDASILFEPFDGRANPTDTRAVRTLVKSYYAASAAVNGAKACSLLDANLAIGVGADQARSGGSAGNRCAVSMSLLLEQQHKQLIAENVATMTVTSVHVKGNLGVAALGFRRMPESEILVEREGHTWKIDALFGGDMP